MDFQKTGGLIPAIIQDSKTSKVLMLGYMNPDALEKTRTEKRVTFFSRSKNRLWTKGEESGNFLDVTSIHEDCDRDTLLIKVRPVGPVCHTGSDTCFQETNEGNFLDRLEAIIEDRKQKPDTGSYTSSLFSKGTSKIAQKVGEEATELVIEAMKEDREAFLNEAADLLFHYMVLLRAKSVELEDVVAVLKQRDK